MRSLDRSFQDIRYAARSLRKKPGFAAAAILTLALGTGANTAVFSVVRAVLLDPLPYAQPDRLVMLGTTGPGAADTAASRNLLLSAGNGNANVPYAVAEEWRARNHSLSSVSSYQDSLGVLILDGEAEMLRGLRVRYDFFDTLGVKKELGRTFRPEEDQPGRRREIILSNNSWVRRFGADPHIIGRVLQLSEAHLTVVGVLPATFEPLLKASSELTPEMYIPLGLAPGPGGGVRVVARLKPGVTIGEARAEMNALTLHLAQEQGAPNWQQAGAAVIPLRDRLLGPVIPSLWATLGAAGFVLLIACANVANLVLERGAGRTKEMAARAAMGASRGRLAAQLITENLLLASLGGLAGILLAFTATHTLVSLAPPQILRLQLAVIDAPVLLFGLAASVLTGLLFGLAPALRHSRVDLNQTLKTTGNAGGCSGRKSFQNGLAIAEVAVAFVLVMGASLMLKSFVRLSQVDLGFDPHNILTLTTNVWSHRQPGYYEQVLERLRAIPGVEGAAFSDILPMDQIYDQPLIIEGHPIADPSQAPHIEVARVTPDFFRVMRISLKRGRLFPDHPPQGVPMVLINESCARLAFPGENPIGKHIMLGEVIGVVGDVRLDGLDRLPAMQAYTPLYQIPTIARLVARTAGYPYRWEGPIRNAFLSVDKMQPVYHVKSLEDYVSGTVAERSFTFALLGLFGGLALVLGAIGIYGVISYAVSRRTREIGIRMALGAESGDVVRAVLHQALGSIVAGLALGLGASLALNRLIASLLFEIRPADGTTAAEVVGLLAVVAIAAAYLPARRAAALNPTTALRQD